MSEIVTPTPADVAAKVDSPDRVNENPPADQGADPAQDAIDWKAEARKWEARAKENREAAAKLAAIEESQKTEAQKLAEKIAQLEQENSAFKQREQIAEWSREITKDSHIPADVLRGDSEEELKAHFEQLLSLVPEPTPQQTVIPGGAETNSLALNGDGIEDALRRALGIN